MHRTHGADLLTEALETRRQVDVAAALSRRLGRTIYQATISSWASGRNVPRGVAIVALQEELGIPFVAWSQPSTEPPIKAAG